MELSVGPYISGTGSIIALQIVLVSLWYISMDVNKIFFPVLPTLKMFSS